jgi:hypothetical protein
MFSQRTQHGENALAGYAKPTRAGFAQQVDALFHSAPYSKQGRSRAAFDVGPVLLMTA